MALEDEAQALTKTIKSLRDNIEKAIAVRDDLDKLTTRSIVNRHLINFVAVLTIVGIFVTAGLIVTIIGQRANSDRIDHLVTVQHDSALCPLYKLFLALDTPAGAAAARARGDDMAVRAQQFAIIRQSYAALKCDA